MSDQSIQTTTDQLVTDLKTVVADSEELFKEVAGGLGERGQKARARLAAALESAKATCGELQKKAKAGAQVADTAVREHPYTSIGIAFGIGLLVGVLVARK